MNDRRSARGRAARLAPAALVPLIFAGAAPAAMADADYDTIYPTGFYNNLCRDYELNDFPRHICQTDNITLTIFREGSIGSQGQSEIRTVLDREFHTTDLNVKYPSSPTYRDDSETDIIYQRGDIPNSNALGVTWCNNAYSNQVCDQHYVRFSVDLTLTLACHETGHAVGLVHGDNATPRGGLPYLTKQSNAMGCMQTEPLLTDAQNGGQLGSLNTQNINEEYGPTASVAGGPYPPYKE